MTILDFVKINPENPDESIISKACEILNRGGLVVAPTETRYGLLVRIDNTSAVSKLFEIKGRNIKKPSAIFVKDIFVLNQLAEVSLTARKLVERFLPGPMTLVLKTKKEFGEFFTLNQMTGFRISSSPVIDSILGKTGPLSATSANLSGQAEPDNIAGIYEQLGENIELYLDGGILNNPGSTVVEIVNDQVRILREGPISADEIMKAINH